MICLLLEVFCTKDRSDLKSWTLAVNWWCEPFFFSCAFNNILYILSCCFNSCYLPLMLQMLSSKDVNFMGYTYKNFEIVNDHEVPGISNLSFPFYVFSIIVYPKYLLWALYPYGIYFCFFLQQFSCLWMFWNFFFSWIKEEKQQTKETYCEISLQYDFLPSPLLSYILGAYTYLSVADIIVLFTASPSQKKKLESEGNLKNLKTPALKPPPKFNILYIHICIMEGIFASLLIPPQLLPFLYSILACKSL